MARRYQDKNGAAGDFIEARLSTEDDNPAAVVFSVVVGWSENGQIHLPVSELHKLADDLLRYLQILEKGNDKLLPTEIEKALLWMFVKTVAIENDCKCGVPPFVDGNSCSVCTALFMLQRFGRHSKNIPKKGD